jgi:hypothetical protein
MGQVRTTDPVLRSEYLRRVYMAVDGLWYIMVEKHFGSETVLSLDKEVWKIMPKIAARKIKDLLGLPDKKLESLSESLAFRFAVEGYEVKSHRLNENSLEIQIASCPWRLQMLKLKKVELLTGVAEKVCPIVYETWGREFMEEFRFEMNPQICKGADICQLKYSI